MAKHLYTSCQRGHIEIVKLLLNDNRVDINKPNNKDATPFYVAYYYKRIEVVKLLLNDKRIDINKANIEGETLLNVICSNGWIEIMKLLLSRRGRVDLHLKNKSGKTAIETARTKENEEKRSWESEEQLNERKRKYKDMIDILESYQRNPDETRTKLRIQLGLTGKNFIFIFF